jgi:beta-lactamase superfamily II metal-dependent hydrolase
MATGSGKVRIRMYNVGFGDCFLLTLPTPNGDRNVVIDCGSVKAKVHDIGKVADQVIADVKDASGKARIDVLILSHRHRDHLSGFADAARWQDVEVGEVWMPWVESRTDPAAKKIRREQQNLALAIQRAASARNALEVVKSLDAVALNALSNDDSLDTLHGGFTGKPKVRFFPSGKSVVEKVGTGKLPGIDVFVLGPPHDRAALNLPEPPKDQILLDGFGANSPDEAFRPFGGDWEWEPEAGGEVFDAGEIDKAASFASLYQLAAAKLDADINNTSLILVFRVGKDYLLFPGDAQWGPWEIVLNNNEACELLRKVTFLKVSHHSSHNGTPKKLMDTLGTENSREKKVFAMVSMTPYSQWKGIPHIEIFKRFVEQKVSYIVSDADIPRTQPEDAAFVRDAADLYCEITLP